MSYVTHHTRTHVHTHSTFRNSCDLRFWISFTVVSYSSLFDEWRMAYGRIAVLSGSLSERYLVTIPAITAFVIITFITTF